MSFLSTTLPRFLILTLSGCLLPGIAAAAEHKSLLRIYGSTTIQPAIEALAADYQSLSGTTLEIRGGGSSDGIRAVRQGEADVAKVSRDLSAAEKQEFAHITIGYDALAIIVNRTNPTTSITREELRDIYTGKRTTWGLGIPPNDKIILISKQLGRGTLDVFEKYSGLISPWRGHLREMDQDLIAAHAWESGANLDVILWVGGLPTAIGFVSMGDAQRFQSAGQPIRKLIIDGSLLDHLSVQDGEYPIRRELNLLFRHGDERAQNFAGFMLSNTAQQELQTQNLVPLVDLGSWR
jgi:phosphate transport system substrate-binding protein